MDGGFNSGLAKREAGSVLTRFKLPAHAKPVSREGAELSPNHPAVVNATTMYPSRVFDPANGHTILVSGHNNSKIGKRVTKGPWAGMPIYTITLEERATCPRSCPVFAACYGNGMHMAKRKRYTPDFAKLLNAELFAKEAQHPGGFVVRLHVLGDFPDVRYVQYWWYWLRQIPALHVWGYTAHNQHTEIGQAIAKLNGGFPSRWRVRFSVAPKDVAGGGFLRSTVIWKDGAEKGIAGGILCPVETGRTETCGTCGLCWNQAADSRPIVFVGHGMQRASGPRGPQKRIQEPIDVSRSTTKLQEVPETAGGAGAKRGRPVTVNATPDYVRGYNAGYQAALRGMARKGLGTHA